MASASRRIPSRARVLLAATAFAGALALAGCAPAETNAVAVAASAVAKTDGYVDPTRLAEPGALPDVVVGRADAPVTIVEYASMTCDHCAAFHREVLPELKRDLIDTGKAKLVLREFPFDPAATAAFMLARCAPGGARTEMVDLLYARSDEWAHTGQPGASLLKIAKTAGFDDASFSACLSDKELQGKVAATMEKARDDYGVTATPTFFVEGVKLQGGRPARDFSAIVEAVEKARAAD